MFCSSCGSQQPSGGEVCSQCGHRMVPVSPAGPPAHKPAPGGRVALMVAAFVALLALAAVAGYTWHPPTPPDREADVPPSATTTEVENEETPDSSKAAENEEPPKAEPSDTTPAEGKSDDLGGDPKTVLNGFLTAYFGGEYQRAQQYLTGKAAAGYKPDEDRSGTEYLGFEIKEGPLLVNDGAEFRVALRWTFTGMTPKESMERYTLVKTGGGWRISSMPFFP